MQTEDFPHPSLISNALLRALAKPDYDASLGEFDAETRATLAVALPEIAAELLARRQTGSGRAQPQKGTTANPTPLSATIIPLDLIRARRIAATPHNITRRTLIDACRQIVAMSPCPVERSAAANVLAETGDAA